MGGSKPGHIILLGDGTEVLTDQNSGDNLENQGQGSDSSRSDREATPGPEERSEGTPDSTQTEQSDSSSEAKTSAMSDEPSHSSH